MQIDHYQIDILIQGFPGKTVCHGSLGWSTVVLMRGAGRVVLVDVGSFNVRALLRQRLAVHGLTPEDVTDVVLTHAHWDHMVNWTLFKQARIAIGNVEMQWAMTAPWGLTPVPELYVEALDRWPTIERLEDTQEVLPGMSAHMMPGHTPGHLIFVLHGQARDLILTGDAAKNRAELLSGRAASTAEAAQSAHSLHAIMALWEARPGNILIPGHDVPMVLDATAPAGIRYIAEREAAIDCWFGDDLEQIKTYRLTV